MTRAIMTVEILATLAFFVINGIGAVELTNDIEAPIKTQFEAVFQGHCGHGSPCEQLCYELHDGMYECDCREGFELHQDGYSCFELNSTAIPTLNGFSNDDEDILYQKGASFSAHLSTSLDYNETLESNITNSNLINNEITNEQTTRRSSSLDHILTTLQSKLEQKSPKLTNASDVDAYTVTKSLHASDNAAKVTSPLFVANQNNVYDRVNVNNSRNSSITQPAVAITTETSTLCPLSCNNGGVCALDKLTRSYQCLCQLGYGDNFCDKELTIHSPRFLSRSWLAFPPLKAAYKHVQLSLEIRPESYDGIFFLTGERDDMAGDFMAILLHQGFVEFRFDCGSGVGVVRSEDTVLLNQWNRLTVYRHRWDAWIQLNDGKHIRGRSKGLFSRITFREPLFIGGPGNTTGLLSKLPISAGFRGCVRHLEVNDHVYRFSLSPHGDALKGFGVEECTADRCSHVPCQHGGKCLTSGDSAVCVCPLGYAGDLCETQVDLQVPAFNGSSYLRYRGIGEQAISWLDLQITFKPTSDNGMLLYNGCHNDGSNDFIAVYMNEGYLEFAFDLGTGTAIARSDTRISLGDWHELKVSRTGRLGIFQVDNLIPLEVWSPGAFTQLTLPQNLFLGGVPNFAIVTLSVPTRSSFVGCIQKVTINNQALGILAEALGGANVDNCPHPCIARPCGDDGICIPEKEYFSCRCRTGFEDPLCTFEGRQIAELQIPQFSGLDSYLHFNNLEILQLLSNRKIEINIRFKIVDGNGLLLWTDRLSLGLEWGSLIMRHYPLAGADHLVYNLTRIDDGLWHRLRAVWTEGGGSLEIDSAPVVTAGWASNVVQKHSRPVKGLYVGGLPKPERTTHGKYSTGIIGCVSDLVLDSEYHIKLFAMTSGKKNVGMCTP